MRKATLCALATFAVVLGLAACGGSEPSGEPDSPAVTTTEEPAAPGATANASLAVEVKDGQPVGGPKELTVSKGDQVTIEVSVDAPQEIHVHGYDVEAEATPDAPAVIELTADLEGVFDVESHASEALLVKLVVEP